MAEPHAGREEARRLRPTRGVAHDRPVPSDVEAPARRPAGVRTMMPGAEQRRLEEANASLLPWKRWGPYLSERQWGTVREDYSDTGEAWEYFPHDHARSRAYRWGEDGIAGISDDKQRLCFAIALWNGADPILKERLFGLSNAEGNHGEDVKEYYYYLDCTPTHSYMRYLYKYPQRAFPYADLVETNRRRSRRELEYELIDTGVFDDDRYFDVFVEYAKATPDDILIRITAANRGAGPAPLHVLPTLWYRNRWTWRSRRPMPPARRSTMCFGPARARPTSSTIRSRPRRSARTSGGSCGRRSRGCSGTSSTTTTTSTAGSRSTTRTQGR